MDIQGTAATTTEVAALQQQQLSAALVTKTLDRLNTNMQGMTPTMNADYEMQKSVLTAAYSERGLGTRLDTQA